MVNNKIKISELAKDFNLQGKDICAALSAMGMSYKPSQSVSSQEVGMLFDYLTQKNQMNSLEDVRATAVQAAEQRKQAAEDRIKKQQEEAAARIRAEEKAKEELIRKNNPPKQEAKQQPKQQPKARPQGQTLQHTPPEKKEEKPVQQQDAQASQKGQKHYVDTRGNSVNIEKYDERMDTLVPQQAGRFGNQQTKQKLVKKDQRGKQFGNKRRQEEQEKMKRLEQQAQIKKAPLKVLIPDEISVGELASRLKKTAAEVIKQLMKLGVLASVSQNIDYDTASLVAMELGAIPEKEVVVTIEERLFDEREDTTEELVERAPVVVVMGHVDHGKTSLLDAIRSTSVTAGEAGGITQHIGAYRVTAQGREITFLDTPGHAAFTSMRARGAQVTDIAILVVAADDGIMPQTIEAINHAKAANVPLIVAVNKMDKPTANPDRILQQLTEHELVPEDWGGETIVCPISAKMGTGIDNLLEMVLLTADMQELKANPNRLAKGTVIEAKLDRGRGPVATVLVQNGTLNHGDIVIAGTAVGRVRAMTDEKGRKMETAGPSVPVEIVGLAEVPGAGDLFYAVEDERMARTLAEKRKFEEKERQNASMQKVTLENLFSSIEQGSVKDLNIIVKADVQGSAEAVKASLEKLSNSEVRVRVIHNGVGGINSSDIMLAEASNAIVVGFNVRPEAGVADAAAASHVDMRLYRIIYDCLEEIEQAMKGMLAPTFKEVILGHAEVRQTFKVSGVGTIAGCYVQDGKMQRNEKVRIVRDSIVVFEGDLSSLKRFKDDAKEVASGYECGLSFEKFNDVKVGDIIEAYVMEQIER
ncbi:MAG: translation initiation factor IF-2 [Clostridia bacterium]|nr:translation initiation factor IF-2 [Clostridia bacterium]